MTDCLSSTETCSTPVATSALWCSHISNVLNHMNGIKTDNRQKLKLYITTEHQLQ